VHHKFEHGSVARAPAVMRWRPPPDEMLLRELQVAVSRLPARRRMAFVLCEMRGVAVAEVSFRMKIEEIRVVELVASAYGLLARAITKGYNNPRG
jgi:DNA-directed RNA polymerase specialized sigma24 family protein